MARAVGTGWQRLERAREVVRAAERDPYLRHLVVEMDETGDVAAAHKKLQAVLSKYRGDPNGDHGSHTQLSVSLCPDCGSDGHRPVKIALTVTRGPRDGLMLSHCLDDNELHILAALLVDARASRCGEPCAPPEEGV